MTTDKQKQALMHKNFFDRCNDAIDSGFYMEAILMEYAAIEARLEVLLGVIGLPCNKFQDDKVRKNIQISHRINCADKLLKSAPVFEKTKLEKQYFKKLGEWIKKRNRYIHGLYKNEIQYSARIKDKDFAEAGLKYCRCLYDEVNRMKRLQKNHPEMFCHGISCASSKCTLNQSGENATDL